MKTLLASWCVFTGSSLRRSSVDMDVKVDILNMCFCVIRLAKISSAEIETRLQSLCEEVTTGIHNVILSSDRSSKRDILGLGVNVKKELHVSCLCRIYIMSY